MMKTDPYAPCPCGSGKKYKFCCAGKSTKLAPIKRPLQAERTKAIKLKGEFDMAWGYYQQSRYSDAEILCRYLLEQDPGYADALHLVGLIGFRTKQPEVAASWIEQAIAIQPRAPEYHVDLGNVLQVLGRLDEALAAYKKALKIKPRYSQAFCNMGNALRAMSRQNEAIGAYKRAIEIDPQNEIAYLNIGLAYGELKDWDSAIHFVRRAIALKPDYWTAMNVLANMLARCGFADEAIEFYETALAGKEDLLIRSNLVFTMNYSSKKTPQEIYRKHAEFTKLYCLPESGVTVHHENSRDPKRTIKIGFVSPDLREHSVSYFMEALLKNYDKNHLSVFAYVNFIGDDSVSLRLQSYCKGWQYIGNKSDLEAADIIRKDGIDILVDLAGHTGGTRIMLFTQKPAPIQVTWLGYPNTTGMDVFDYRITDVFGDPVGMTEAFYSEKLIRLPETFCCFTPCIGNPEWVDESDLAVVETPAIRKGYITFASLNNVAKLSDDCLELWARVLEAVPDARLKLYLPGSKHNKLASGRIKKILDHKVKLSDRVEFIDWMPLREYFHAHHEIDIALDPFPYNGGTTSFQAVWMGVPVLTLAGKSFASRMGVSLMSNLDLKEFIAETTDDYVAVAQRFSSDIQRLNTIRMGLRGKLETSPLMDGKRFASNMETVFTKMWEEFCHVDDAAQ